MFPTKELMLLCFTFKIFMLVVTLTAQIGIIMTTNGLNSGGSFSAIIILNITFSITIFCIKVLEMVMKYLILRGETKDENSAAARKKNILDRRNGRCSASPNLEEVYEENAAAMVIRNPMRSSILNTPGTSTGDSYYNENETTPFTKSHERQIEEIAQEVEALKNCVSSQAIVAQQL